MTKPEKKPLPHILLALLCLIAIGYFIKLSVDDNKVETYLSNVFFINFHGESSDKKKYQKAIKDLDKGIGYCKNRRFSQETLCLLYYRKAQLFNELFEYKSAIKALKQAIPIAVSIKLDTKKFGNLRTTLIETYQKQKEMYLDGKDYDNAIDFFTKEKVWMGKCNGDKLFIVVRDLEEIIKEIKEYIAQENAANPKQSKKEKTSTPPSPPTLEAVTNAS